MVISTVAKPAPARFSVACRTWRRRAKEDFLTFAALDEAEETPSTEE